MSQTTTPLALLTKKKYKFSINSNQILYKTTPQPATFSKIQFLLHIFSTTMYPNRFGFVNNYYPNRTKTTRFLTTLQIVSNEQPLWRSTQPFWRSPKPRDIYDIQQNLFGVQQTQFGVQITSTPPRASLSMLAR